MTWPGKKLELHVPKRGRVMDVKQKIFEAEGIPPAMQRLIYRAQELEDEYRLYDYDIRKLDYDDFHTLILVIRLRPDPNAKTIADEMIPLDVD